MIDFDKLKDGTVSELIVRVSQYGPDMKTPTSFQAIAKYRDAPSGPWGVGVCSNPEAAIRTALDPVRNEPPAPKLTSPYGF